MIAAWLCGAFFGGLFVWERWAHAERQRRYRELLDTLPPSEPDWSEYVRAWDQLSDEALANFERLVAAPYDSATDHISQDDPAHFGKGWGPDPYDAASVENYT